MLPTACSVPSVSQALIAGSPGASPEVQRECEPLLGEAELLSSPSLCSLPPAAGLPPQNSRASQRRAEQVGMTSHTRMQWGQVTHSNTCTHAWLDAHWLALHTTPLTVPSKTPAVRELP